MVIDHIAWGFVDFYSPLGQFLHVLGRFTIPIMCFFIAEGFRKTHDLKKYMGRMAMAAAASVIPFYLFFGEEYGYRQNIIFDYLLGMLMLVILEKTSLKKWQKLSLVGLLFVISATVGGWIITPSCFILAFYYGRSFAEKVKWFVITDLITVAFLVCAILLNGVYHFSHYEWVWWDKFYLLGFMLALPLIYCYNGEKGRDIFGRGFFYIFYPAHFIVLYILKKLLVEHCDVSAIYLGVHILVLMAGIIMLEGAANSRPSKAQTAICIFLVSASVYILGFIIEILAASPEGYYLACIVQYFGEYSIFISILLFVASCCMVVIPRFVYTIHIVISLMLMYSLANTRKTGFFYSYIGVTESNGMFRPVLDHSTGFFISFCFMIVMCLEIISMAIYIFRQGSPIERKRMRLILWAMFFCWMPYLVTLSGITHGFEIPAVGLIGAGAALYLCFFKYGGLDSVTLASENALDRAQEGILVLNDRYRISFHNSIVDRIIGDLPLNTDARRDETLSRILNGELAQIEVGDRIYETQVEELTKQGYIQGIMIWFLDVTEHMANMKHMQELAHHDALTGLYNRSYFKEAVDLDVAEGRTGCFLMMDMDNFKLVNDRYGHQRGDSVLKNLANILAEYPEEDMYSCRVGGDEFCAYLRRSVDRDHIEKVIKSIMDRFGQTFRADDEVKCTISVGVCVNDDPDALKGCSAMYSDADDKLYEAKAAGKNAFRM